MKDSFENRPDCTIFLLAKAYQKGHGLIKKRLKPYGLTNMQHLVLEGIWYREGITATELGRILVLDKATLSGVLERMLDASWITKLEDKEDKRSIHLFSSDKARRLKTELLDIRIQANADLLSSFSLEERLLFKRLLWDLVDIP
jgi:DNA-binding MarR family transcriptional regulator